MNMKKNRVFGTKGFFLLGMLAFGLALTGCDNNANPLGGSGDNNQAAVIVLSQGGVKTVTPGGSLQFFASVPPNDTAKPMIWSVTLSGGAKMNGTGITSGGVLTVDRNERAGGKLIVKATDAADSSKSGTATLIVKNLHIESKRWVADGNGWSQYYTNVAADCDWIFSHWYSHTGDTYEIDCKKMSGSRDAEYGMVFALASGDNRYHLEITVTGKFRLRKYVGGVFTTIKPWESSEHILTGYYAQNRLKVNKNGDSYAVFINGNPVYQFTDTDVSGTQIGFSASTGSYADESFPNTPVDVRFKVIK